MLLSLLVTIRSSAANIAKQVVEDGLLVRRDLGRGIAPGWIVEPLNMWFSDVCHLRFQRVARYAKLKGKLSVEGADCGRLTDKPELISPDWFRETRFWELTKLSIRCHANNERATS